MDEGPTAFFFTQSLDQHCMVFFCAAGWVEWRQASPPSGPNFRSSGEQKLHALYSLFALFRIEFADKRSTRQTD